MVKEKYQITLYAGFMGYVVQAVVNCFLPLLFVTFQRMYGIPLSKITLLITINFIIQLVVDTLSAGFVDKIGYKAAAIIANIFVMVGLFLLTVLPELFSDAFVGLLLSVVIYAVGGGLMEVIVSPVVEACPTKHKEKMMSLLHSFYSWGSVTVVLLSTVFFTVFGTESWKLLAIFWMAIPAIDLVLFVKAKIYSLHEAGSRGMTLKELAQNRLFWLLVLMMLAAGASEQSVSQWASTFAEEGLGITKTLGDLVGPMTFALLMAVSRVIYGSYGDRIKLDSFMRFSAVLCVCSYLAIALVPVPVVSLAACGICGFSVGIMWPGTFSKAAAGLNGGGTLLFAMLALAGDLGCSVGPTLVGFVSDMTDNNLRIGILTGAIFPILMLVCLIIVNKKK